MAIEYIERKDVIEKICNLCKIENDDCSYPRCTIINTVKNIPAADVVEKIDTTNYMRCYFCGAPLRLEADFSFTDYGIDDQQGVVSGYSCDNCDTSYQIFKPFKIEESEDN